MALGVGVEQAGRGRAAARPAPRTVIRGEKDPALSVRVDFLNFTVSGIDPQEVCAEVAALLGAAGEERDRGLHGYERSVDFSGYGIVAHGGSAQRGTILVSLNGAGCARIARWSDVRAFGERLHGRITRCDVAADDLDGAALSVQGALAAWRSGAFKVGGQGRSPKAHLRDDLGTGEGCSLYVGSREGGKLARIYEKGLQLGEKLSQWVRGEVEFHAKDRVLPWDMVTDPVRFLAGSYPFFASLSLVAERIRTCKKACAVTLDAARVWARSAVGRTLNVLLHAAGGDIGAVVLDLRRDGVPRRLVGFFDPDGSAVGVA